MTKNMDTIDIIMGLEGGELLIEDREDWEKVKSVAKTLAPSQGFYGRLLNSMLEFEENYTLEDKFPLYM